MFICIVWNIVIETNPLEHSKRNQNQKQEFVDVVIKNTLNKQVSSGLILLHWDLFLINSEEHLANNENSNSFDGFNYDNTGKLRIKGTKRKIEGAKPVE